MNFWTGLILGIIIGWLVEWLIDWLFWRRDIAAEPDEALAGQRLAEVELDYQDKLAAAELDYHERLAAVEDEWRERLNLNEQQWQNQFTAVEADRATLRAQVDELPAVELVATEAVPDEGELDEAILGEGEWAALDAPAGAVLAAAGLAVAAEQLADDESEAISKEDPFDTREMEAAGPAAALPVADRAWPEAAATVRQDDLTRVHGIGPRYAALLADGGITTFDDLTAADPEQLRAILKPGPMHQPNFSSWAAQAAALAATRAAGGGDDLTKLEGIGPMYAERLQQAGVTSFAALAETDEARLAEIISAPAWRRINFGDWIAQARLAAAGDTAGLEELQGRLFRREGDNLSLIRGIGQRSAAGLHAAGLDTFAALAAATPEQVEAAVRAGGGRGGDYAAWIDEAGQRAAGRRVARATRRPKTAFVAACPQDLSTVPGIGSVYEERLYAAGIGTYWELAELPADSLVNILGESAGRADIGSIKAEAMRLAAETNSIGRGWSGAPPDDFEQLGGIGEVYEHRLYNAGICTFAALAATTPERLAEICQAPALRAADYAAWIAHAVELAAARSG